MSQKSDRRSGEHRWWRSCFRDAPGQEDGNGQATDSVLARGCGRDGDGRVSGRLRRRWRCRRPGRPARPRRSSRPPRHARHSRHTRHPRRRRHDEHRQQRADQSRRDRGQRGGLGRPAADGHHHQRDDRQPAGRQVHRVRQLREGSRRPRQHQQERDRGGRELPEPVLRPRQARAGRVRRTEQVGELHRHLGAELGHGLGGAEPPEHRQHRHARRQRRRQLHLHLLPRHHDRQVAARRDDREPAEQHRRPRRRELSTHPDAPRDHRPLGQRAGDRQQHADRRHVERRLGADEAPGQRHLRLHSGDRCEGHGERLLARGRLHRQLRGVPPPARRHPGVERGGRRRGLPWRQPQRNPVLRGLSHRAAPLRPDGGHVHLERRDPDVHLPDAARRRPRGRQLPELRPQDPHGAVPGPRELRLRRRAAGQDHVSAGHPQLHVVP